MNTLLIHFTNVYKNEQSVQFLINLIENYTGKIIKSIYFADMKEEIKDERLKNIILSAENVFFEKGYSKVSVSAICKAANCSRTTLYSHFANKENIYLAVINNSFKIFLRYFFKIKFSRENGLEKMLKYAKGYIEFSKKHPKNYSMIVDFYALLRTINDKNLHSDVAILISKCSFFPEVQQNAILPSTFLLDIIKEGQQDGSINNNISGNVLFLNVWAYLIGCSNLFNFSTSKKDVSILGLKIKSTERVVLNFVEKILS